MIVTDLNIKECCFYCKQQLHPTRIVWYGDAFTLRLHLLCTLALGNRLNRKARKALNHFENVAQ